MIINKAPMTSTPEYHAWSAMKQRCTNPKCRSYGDYGGRGISICPEWIDSPKRFISDMGKRPSSSHSIDRIDVNANYNPKNCQWATLSMQSRNKKINSIQGVGIRYQSPSKKWHTYIRVDGKQRHIGSFASRDEALRARDQAELDYWGYTIPKTPPKEQS